jgi:hypothetical protein
MEVVSWYSQQTAGGSGRSSQLRSGSRSPFWPARVAARKGHSFFGYFIFSLIFFPAALIVAYMVSIARRGLTPAYSDSACPPPILNSVAWETSSSRVVAPSFR